MPLVFSIFVMNTGFVYFPEFAIEAYAAVRSRGVTPFVIPPSVIERFSSFTAEFMSLVTIVDIPMFFIYSIIFFVPTFSAT